MSDPHEIPLPDLHKAVLDAATVRTLLADIATHAELIGCILKGASQTRADNDWVSLQEAQQLLLSGEARGVQIRYRHEGAQWWDTLMQAPQGVQSEPISRIRTEDGDARPMPMQGTTTRNSRAISRRRDAAAASAPRASRRERFSRWVLVRIRHDFRDVGRSSASSPAARSEC